MKAAWIAVVVVVVVAASLIASTKAEANAELATRESCAASCAKLCIGKDSSCPKACLSVCKQKYPKNQVGAGGSVLGSFIRPDAIQHVGVTVSNLTASLIWYTEVLGGKEAIGAGGDGWMGDDVFNLLLQKEQLDAAQAHHTLTQQQIAKIYAAGSDVLAARYVNFGALQIELLDYRSRPEMKSDLPFYHSSSSPTIVNNMHISIHINEDTDLNEFVNILEEESHKRGYTQVRCNRLVHVDSETERQEVGKQLKFNSFLVKEGVFKGWALAYCKGPDGEQLEFNQEFDNAKASFDDAMKRYLASKW